ncbi:LtfC-like domain-containing protein [Nocardia rhizosphaerae]|uniref:LtfC/p132/Gp6 beta-sandwich domain-containing protein n=1 Tax=Nocardia rhizosphaerae TaxID=1691571 RepID=A0ABV8L854_9NOCA
MATAKQLGHDPTNLTLVLSKGADFVHTLALPAGSVFPSGSAVRIVVLDNGDNEIANWQAVLTETEARFVVQAELADIVPAGAKYRLYVSYPTTPSTEYLWFFGAVRRKQ